MEDRRALYRRFCRKTADLPVFFQDWHLDAVCAGGQWDAAVICKGEEPIAVWPYFLKHKWGFRYISMPPFTKFMGPWFGIPPERLTDEHRLLDQLHDQLPRVHAVKQEWHYSRQNWLPLYWKGYRQTTRYSYCLALRDPHEWKQGLNRNMQRNLRKAARALTLDISDDLERFYRLNSLSFNRQGLRPPYSFAQLERHDAALREHQARRIFFARDARGRDCSAAYLIWDARSAYYHLSGDDPALRHLGGGILLIQEAIHYTCETLQLPVFDFEGSMLRSVEAIRRQFGAQQQPYFRIHHYPSRLYQWIDRMKGTDW